MKLKVGILLAIVLAVCVFAISQNKQGEEEAHAYILDPSESISLAASLETVKSYTTTRTPGKLINNLPDSSSLQNILEQSDAYTLKVAPLLAQNHTIEMFGIYTPKSGDTNCSDCKRVELYDFSGNSAIIAYIDSQVRSLEVLPGVQPDIPPHLLDIAKQISNSHPKTQEEMEEYDIKAQTEAMMPNTKTTVRQSRCELQKHLCVAPTYVTSKGALWTIVDLTDLYLAGISWTNYADDYEGDPQTLQKIAFTEIDKKYCQKTTHFTKGDWSADYALSSSDGLVITNLQYKQKQVVDSIKLADWHVNYSKKDNFGYADAVGCPVFSQAAVVAATAPEVVDLDDKIGSGIALKQEFWSDGWPGPCNYYYTQWLNMYPDGSFRVVAESDGRGCGDDATYRPILRIKLAQSQSAIKDITRERWFYTKDQQSATFAETADYTLISPTDNSLRENEVGDNAIIYWAEGAQKDEGDSDISTLGSCCSVDHRQGPDVFINDEEISGDSTVLWYIAQLKNSGQPGNEQCWARTIIGDDGKQKNQVFPCSAGPYFKRKST